MTYPNEPKWYRDIIFDTFRIPPGGISKPQNVFDNMSTFPNGEKKIHGLHTNMTQNGCLGTPRQFKVYYWGVTIEEVSGKEDVQKILQNLKMRLVFGGDTTMQGSSLSVFSPTLFISDGMASEQVVEGYRIYHKVNDWKVFNEQVGECLKRFNLDGIWTHYHRAVWNEKYEPLYLDSTTSFRVEMSAQKVDLKAPAILKVTLIGLEARWGSPPW